MKSCVVAMSGGVDSSVAALLLLENYSVHGMMLSLHEYCDPTEAEDLCTSFGLPFSLIDGREQFNEKVISRFVSAYASGITPNPCVLCNRGVKFAELLRFADENKFDNIATGHYAKISFDASSGRYLLSKAHDLTKDQSYVLSVLRQDVLSRLLLPLAELTKSEVRALAEEKHLHCFDSKESQDICFIPDGDYASFIESYIGHASECGDFVSTDGKLLGQHKGLLHYTIGQRKGIGLSFDSPRYVVGKNASDNRVTLGLESDLYTDRISIEGLNFIPFDKLTSPLKVKVRTRYKQVEQAAVITPTGNDSLVCELSSPLRAVTPGQTAVFYDADIVVGCGTITGCGI